MGEVAIARTTATGEAEAISRVFDTLRDMALEARPEGVLTAVVRDADGRCLMAVVVIGHGPELAKVEAATRRMMERKERERI
jgi:hypothetical protein